MENNYYYSAKVKWVEGKLGEMTNENFPAVKVATPPEFTGGIPNTWSPEHLFVSSVNICIMTTFLAIAENSKLEFESFESEVKGKLDKIDNKYMITEISVFPVVVIKYEKDKDRALRIIEKSEVNCIISNSVKSRIILDPKVEFSKS
jgi:organic hydroperoxide reductase OsmC/OhrA